MTTVRYRIQHHTRLNYDRPARNSHNEVRMTPVSEPGQLTLESRLRVRPVTWNATYVDHWGTTVTSLESSPLHDELSIEAISTVERTDLPTPGLGLGWADLRDERLVDGMHEFLAPSRRTHLDEASLAALSHELDQDSPAAAVATACRLVHDRVRYTRGVTTVQSTAQHALRSGQGVCQDIAHATLAVLRSLGVPARYVSGYLCPLPDLPVGETVGSESHAWLEWWDGAWVAADPTNLRPVGLDHVVVARGRDYDDVPPMRGVYQGRGASTLRVSVEFTRLS